MEHKVRVLEIEQITPNVKRYVLEKPEGFSYVSGQHTKFSLPGFEKPKSFTMTSLPEDNYLEFIIKIYNERNGFTKKLGELKVGDGITILDASGKLTYQGKGLFIAAGTGITPFISILRKLKKEEKLSGNKLIYSNKIYDDVILHDELKELLRRNYIRVLTREEFEGFHYGRVDAEFLKPYVKDYEWFYLCGPKDFVLAMRMILSEFGVKHEQVIA